MPRTASTRPTDRPLLKARPSSKNRGTNYAAITPVLFRLPMAQRLHALPPQDETESGPQATLAPETQPLTRQDFEREESPSAVEQPVRTMASAEAKPQSAAVSESPQPPPVQTRPIYPRAATEVQPAAARSWWEHWSSGIVLILLIIALITASIIAFTDTSSTDPDLLADKETEPPSGFDLEDIHIPDVQLPQTDANPVATATPQTAPQPESTESAQDPGLEGSQVETEQVAEAQVADESDTAGGEDTLIPGSLALGSGKPDHSSLEQTPANQTPHAPPPELTLQTPPSVQVGVPESTIPLPATLSPPVGQPEPTLFPEQQALASSPAPTDLVPTLPVSSGDHTPPQPPVAGQSPSIYDEASTGSPLTSPGNAVSTTASSVTTPGGNTTNAIDTNMQPYSALLAGTSQPQPAHSPASHPTVTMAKQTLPAGPVPPLPSQASPVTPEAPHAGVINSSTPNLDADALIRAFQHYREQNEVENRGPTNRYRSTPADHSPAPKQTGLGQTSAGPFSANQPAGTPQAPVTSQTGTQTPSFTLGAPGMSN